MEDAHQPCGTIPHTTNPLFVCLRRNSLAAVRLFCFPYAGGGASVFRNWAEHLPGRVELWGIQYPGRESRINETPFAQLSTLARAIHDALDLYRDKPFVFYGHSVGGLISFEVARELRRNTHVLPLCLCVSGCSAPHVLDPDPPIHALPESEFLEKLRLLNGTPKQVLEAPEFRKIFIPTLRADFALRETYEYTVEHPLNCPIRAFGGINDPEVSLENLEAWCGHTQTSFEYSMYPGDHFFLHTSRQSLLQRLFAELTQYVESLSRRTHWIAPLEVSS